MPCARAGQMALWAGVVFATLATPVLAQDSADRREVSGLVDAQVDMGRRFVRSQSLRLHDRLEALRDATDSRNSGYNIRLDAGDAAGEDDALARQWRELEEKTPGKGGYGRVVASPPAPRDSLLAKRRFDDEGYAVWSAGSVDFGRRNNGMIDIDRTSFGIGSGFDAALSTDLTIGVGLSFDRAIGEAGTYGTRARGLGYGASLYGSYEPAPSVFLDAAVGAAYLDFSNARFLPGEHDMAYTGRSGQQGFGSVSVGYEYRDRGLMLSPYGRFAVSRTHYGTMQEEAGRTSVVLGGQRVDNASAVVAIRGEYAIHLEDAVLRPGARAELTHQISGASAVAATGGGLAIPDFAAPGIGRDQLTLAPMLEADFGDDWSAGVEYRNVMGNDGRDETVTLRLGRKF